MSKVIINILESNKLSILKFVVIIIIFACILISYPSIHAYSIVLTTEYDGNIVIENEKNVVFYLEDVIQNCSEYSMKAFDRKAISHMVQ